MFVSKKCTFYVIFTKIPEHYYSDCKLTKYG